MTEYFRPSQQKFFFKAEDGIRYLIVTGVQTCALPILPDLAQRGRRARWGRGPPAGRVRRFGHRSRRVERGPGRHRAVLPALPGFGAVGGAAGAGYADGGGGRAGLVRGHVRWLAAAPRYGEGAGVLAAGGGEPVPVGAAAPHRGGQEPAEGPAGHAQRRARRAGPAGTLGRGRRAARPAGPPARGDRAAVLR